VSFKGCRAYHASKKWFLISPRVGGADAVRAAGSWRHHGVRKPADVSVKPNPAPAPMGLPAARDWLRVFRPSKRFSGVQRLRACDGPHGPVQGPGCRGLSSQLHTSFDVPLGQGRGGATVTPKAGPVPTSITAEEAQAAPLPAQLRRGPATPARLGGRIPAAFEKGGHGARFSAGLYVPPLNSVLSDRTAVGPPKGPGSPPAPAGVCTDTVAKELVKTIPLNETILVHGWAPGPWRVSQDYISRPGNPSCPEIRPGGRLGPRASARPGPCKGPPRTQILAGRPRPAQAAGTLLSGGGH